MNITGNNNGSLREIMDDALTNLRNADENNYLTSKVRGKIKVVDANKRGFVAPLDYATSGSGGYMNPASGNLVSTSQRSLDRLTVNYQYIQFGHEVDNENLANSKSGLHVGATSKALATKKELDRRLEFEEWYFCRGDGSQVMGDITAGSTGTTITLGGTRDGAGAYMLREGQVIRIYDVTLTTLKGTRTITSKPTNKSIVVNSSITVIDTDVILPEGDSTAPTTTGIKGLPYLVKASGPYFDKTLSNVPALQAIVDAATTTPSRTTMEQLYRRHNSIRNNKNTRTQACVSPAQMSNYFAQFFSANTPNIHISGNERPGVDNGAMSREYTHWGQEIQEYKFLHPKRWENLDFGSFCRLTMKEAGEMLTQRDYALKIANGNYINANVKWSDDYLEYCSVNPAKNSAFTGLTFSGLPLLCDDSFVG